MYEGAKSLSPLGWARIGTEVSLAGSCGDGGGNGDDGVPEIGS